jgi:hypothetical protein
MAAVFFTSLDTSTELVLFASDFSFVVNRKVHYTFQLQKHIFRHILKGIFKLLTHLQVCLKIIHTSRNMQHNHNDECHNSSIHKILLGWLNQE